MKKIFYFLFVILACITMQSYAGKAEQLTQEQTKQIQQIVHDYLMDNPDVLIEVSNKLRQKEAAKEETRIKNIIDNLPKYKKEIFDTATSGRVVTGNPKGKIIMAEFTQYQCGHCKAVIPIVDQFLKNHPEIQFITIYWPFFGGDASYAAKAALAAQKQNKTQELNQAILASNDFLNKEKIDAIVKAIPGFDTKKFYDDINSKEFNAGLQANFKLAGNLGLIGTPTFVFTNKAMTKFSLIPGHTHNIEDDLNKSLKEVS